MCFSICCHCFSVETVQATQVWGAVRVSLATLRMFALACTVSARVTSLHVGTWFNQCHCTHCLSLNKRWPFDILLTGYYCHFTNRVTRDLGPLSPRKTSNHFHNVGYKGTRQSRSWEDGGRERLDDGGSWPGRSGRVSLSHHSTRASLRVSSDSIWLDEGNGRQDG